MHNIHKNQGRAGKRGVRPLIAAVLIALGAAFLICSADLGKNARDETDVSHWLTNRGYTVVGSAVSVTDVTVPAKFSDVYEQYNKLQKKSGFNLKKYRSLTLTKYAYKLSESDLYVNVLVYKAKIVGGDVCSYALGGEMKEI
ncbi:hypothetical protein FACS1894120_1320 [Clostridia bacterium]|nr:hypothetical protein FACS1894120_1320 [Clostridia bacterium]